MKNEDIKIRSFKKEDIEEVNRIWNGIVEEGVAFPQEETLGMETGLEFFEAQSYVGVAYNAVEGRIVGVYILHPNNVGRCGHICNASFAVDEKLRGCRIGEKLVRHCIQMGKEIGFEILQFNAVVENNISALHLYNKLGFVKLGVIPKGFRTKSGKYENIIPHYIEL